MQNLPEPPPNVPRIVEVLSPGENQYVVFVRMPTNLAAKFPDKPWGTLITDIGLSKKDSDLFAGYELVDVEPLKGSPDLYWIFQKLPGPLWRTLINSSENLIPGKYRRFVSRTKTKQEVDPETNPDAITGDLISSVIEQQDNTGKATKINISEEIDVNTSPLIGQLTDTWGINTTSEQLVDDGASVSSGYGIKSSRVVPLGNGKSVKETENFPADIDDDGIVYTLYEEDADALTNKRIDIRKSLVDASRAAALASSSRAAGWFTEVKSLDKWHSIMVQSKMDSTITGVTQTWKETQNIALPNYLEEIGVIWDSNSSAGNGSAGVDNISTIEEDNMRWQVEAEANASAVVSGRPHVKITQGYSGPAEITVTRTFHSTPPTTGITPYIPLEVHGTLTIYGAQKNKVAKSTKEGVGETSTSNSIFARTHQDNNMSIHTFGPVIHSGVSLIQLGDSPTATATGVASGGSTPGGGAYPTATAVASITGVATLSLPASSPPLSSGATFVLAVSVNYYKLGYWVKEVRTAKVP